MGTRVDFYVGVGLEAEWLGSAAYDGFRWHEEKDSNIATSTTEKDFRFAVKKESSREDWTNPEQGWPWPWEDSNTTDYAYCFNEGKVEIYIYGRPADKEDAPKRDDWPNMKDQQNVTLGPRSGIMLLGSKKELN